MRLFELENPAKHHHRKRVYPVEPIKDHYTRDEIEQKILKKIKYFPGGAREMNNGWCWGFANGLASLLGPKAKVVSSPYDYSEGTFPGHSWVLYDGLHYDAESPRGEPEPRLMTYHKRLRAIADGTDEAN